MTTNALAAGKKTYRYGSPLENSGVATLLLGAVLFGWSAFCAIANFSFDQLMFDQWALYESYLTLPFPASVLNAWSGHRMIFPNLVRVAEIHWFAANQQLQIACGTTLLALIVGLLTATAWTERRLPRAARAAAALLIVCALLWLGTARMMLHSNEMLNVYIPILCAVVAARGVYRTHRVQSAGGVFLASVACMMATFSFGPGVATFPMALGLGIVLRLRWPWLLILVLALLTSLALYLWVLPGAGGVRDVLVLQPLQSLLIAARWLSSPWVNAWLGYADPPLQQSMMEAMNNIPGRLLTRSANTAVQLSGLSWLELATAIGLIGLVLFAANVVRAIRIGRELGRLDAVALALGLFATTGAAVFSVGRLTYLQEYPEQVFADRYVIWGCVFWLSLALSAISVFTDKLPRALKMAAITVVFAFPIALLPTHRANSGWAAVVYRTMQQSAAAGRSGVFDARLFQDDPGVVDGTILRTQALLRANRLGMYADPAWQDIGTHWNSGAITDPQISARLSLVDTFVNAIDGLPSARFEGWIADGLTRARRNGPLLLIDADDQVVGLAEFSFIAGNKSSLRLDVPRKRGFDAYVKNYNSGQTYRLVQRDSSTGQGILLATTSAAASQPIH